MQRNKQPNKRQRIHADAITKLKAKYEPPSSFVDVGRSQWLQFHSTLTHHFFKPPPDVKKHWTGSITTDGVSCSWHVKKKYPTLPKPKKRGGKVSRQVTVSSLGPISPSSRPPNYGTHGTDVLIDPLGALNIIAVDPGIVMLIDAVRSHHTVHPLPPLPDDVSRRAHRRDKLTRKLSDRNMTHFSLSNGHWKRECGVVQTRERNLTLIKNLCLQPAIDDLAMHTARVHTSVSYLEHVAAKLRTMDIMKRRMQTKAPRRWAFDCYRKEQLAIHKLSKDLLEGCTGPTLIVWGNGGFNPSYRGHAPAPNKRLRQKLSKYVHIILSSEYRSSQRSGCCRVKMKDRPSTRRVTVKQCTSCKTLVSRDVSAACIIHDIFCYQRAHQTNELPPFIVNNNP